MKLIKLLLISTFVLFVSTAQANGVFIGPAYTTDPVFGCGVIHPDYEYWGDQKIHYANSKTGHATFKCRLELTSGDPQISYSEFASDTFPIGECFNTISLEGDKGMWTAQCFGVWQEAP